MKNPLNKRILRELKSDFGKYLVIFLFMVLLISVVSGFLVADNSVSYSYEEGFTKYHLEWGHFTLSAEPDEDFFDELSEKGNVSLYPLNYFEEDDENAGASIRVYKLRDSVNLECVMSGTLPASDDEIAIDRVFAQNAGYEVGDTITLNKKTLTITGFVAVPDYSALFENNTDMMFDSVNFSIAVMTDEGYEKVNSSKEFSNYVWMYEDEPEDETAEKKASDDFLSVLKETLTSYDETLIAQNGMDASVITLDNYIPRYNNQAINFTGDDMGGDKAMIILFNFIVVGIIAFVFAVTISNTIVQESGVIGTLRASGYTKSELVRHYMILPVIVTLISAVIGNIIGYTFLKSYMVELYYNSYSLCTYETLWNMEAFIDTTVLPVILMFVINLVVLIHKLQLSPLNFLRRDLTKKKKKKAFRLNTKIPFLHRFRIRILFQNIPNYITLFVGIAFAAFLLVFSLMFTPLLENYSAKVADSMISTYQYILLSPVETENETAEKYCVSELETTDKKYMTDEISIYGIEENSAYVSANIPDGKVLVSESILKKFGLKTGDTLTLKAKYDDTTYDFVIAGSYSYDAGLAVFMTRETYLDTFEKNDNYFTGYFSNEKLTDLDDNMVASIITQDDMTKVSRQLMVSMGDMMKIFTAFGIIMFLLLMYLLSKQIIEKNKQSISMTKILGFTDGEIGGLYIAATSIVVVLSLLLAVPITDSLLRASFTSYLYTQMTGYIPYIVTKECFIKMILMGIGCYIVTAVLQLYKIKKIPKSDALKNVE